MINSYGRTTGKHRGALVATKKGRAPTPVYLGQAGHTVSDLYTSELSRTGHGSSFKWLVSTCLAAVVGVCAIAFTIYGSIVNREDGGMLDTIRKAKLDFLAPTPVRHDRGKLVTATPKEDRLQDFATGTAINHIIHDTVRQRRGTREFITIKPYTRMVARLAVEDAQETDLIPAFNPFKLYADTNPVGAAAKATALADAATRDGVSIRVVELVGGFLPHADGLELNTDEVAELVTSAALELAESSAPVGDDASGDPAKGGAAQAGDVTALRREVLPPRTTVIEKTVFEPENADSVASGQEIRMVKVREGDSLRGIVQRAGAAGWQARVIAETVRDKIGELTLSRGHTINMVLVPSPTRSFAMEPVQVAIFGGGHRHIVTVNRNEAGQYVASRTPQLLTVARASQAKATRRARASLYRGVYHAALSQKLPPELILKILRIHAYDTDFSRAVRPGDAFEFFFDMKKNAGGLDGKPNTLLYTALTVGGKTHRFYRYRTPDGSVDYYDDKGSNSKRFLMRKPVKGGEVRFTSGFGFRIHPIARRRKMHTGVDWAARRGTPVLAAGNGSVVEAGRKGGYGNYVRIRHANGYQTSYAHMRRIGKGVVKGVRVRQGQIIGYVGSTGYSSGPHLHYEVLVNHRPVNPMRIHVPRGRQLKGERLADFQKKRKHIDNLMSRPPVKTRIAEANLAQ